MFDQNIEDVFSVSRDDLIDVVDDTGNAGELLRFQINDLVKLGEVLVRAREKENQIRRIAEAELLQEPGSMGANSTEFNHRLG